MPQILRAFAPEGNLGSNHYSIFTSGVYKTTALDAAFPHEKPHFPEPDCAE
jgi:hypothetical protein